MLQNEAQALLTSNAQTVKQKVPFDPGSYMNSKKTDKHTEEHHHTSTAIPHAHNMSNSGGGSPRHYRYTSLLSFLLRFFEFIMHIF